MLLTWLFLYFPRHGEDYDVICPFWGKDHVHSKISGSTILAKYATLKKRLVGALDTINTLSVPPNTYTEIDIFYSNTTHLCQRRKTLSTQSTMSGRPGAKGNTSQDSGYVYYQYSQQTSSYTSTQRNPSYTNSSSNRYPNNGYPNCYTNTQNSGQRGRNRGSKLNFFEFKDVPRLWNNKRALF